MRGVERNENNHIQPPAWGSCDNGGAADRPPGINEPDAEGWNAKGTRQERDIGAGVPFRDRGGGSDGQPNLAGRGLNIPAGGTSRAARRASFATLTEARSGGQ